MNHSGGNCKNLFCSLTCCSYFYTVFNFVLIKIVKKIFTLVLDLVSESRAEENRSSSFSSPSVQPLVFPQNGK